MLTIQKFQITVKVPQDSQSVVRTNVIVFKVIYQILVFLSLFNVSYFTEVRQNKGFLSILSHQPFHEKSFVPK